ncbi:MAG: MBG domain-containing protein, partial [Bacillota bacterium]|nr:MBG domain-containing protein [Bacillota bacterium]
TAEASYTLTVTPAAVTVTAEDKTKNVGQADPEFTVKIDGLVDGFKIAYTIDRQKGEVPGKYAIKPAGNASQGNYTVTFVNGTLTIEQHSSADLKLVADNAEKEYDGTALTPVATAIDGAKIEYSKEGEPWSSTPPSRTVVGITTVKVRATKDGYLPAEKIYTIRITPRPVTVTANDKTKKAGATDPAFDATAVGLVGSDTVTYNITRDPGEAPGKYAIKPAGDATQGNYTVTFVNGTLTIEKLSSADLNLVAKDAEKVYDGTPLAPVATAIPGAKIQYSTDDGKTWKDEVPSITKVGTLPLKVRATKDGYDPAEVSITLKVTRKPVTVTANDKTKKAGATDPAFDATVVGLIGADTVAYTISRDPGEAPGKYAIKPAGADAQGNYTVSYVNGTLTIENHSSADLNLVAKDAEKVYDGTPLAPVATAIPGAKIQYSTDDGKTWKDEVPSITTVGTLPVKVRATKDGYDPAEATYTLKVTPKEVIVTANDKSKEFGETDPVFDA